MLVVDTNVLVHAADIDSPFHRRCRAWLDGQRRSTISWYTTWPIIYEFLRVATHSRALRRPFTLQEAWRFVTTLLASPAIGVLTPTERHVDVASEVFALGVGIAANLMHDAHTAILMREHGVRRICTRDTDFHRFKFLEVIDPVQP